VEKAEPVSVLTRLRECSAEDVQDYGIGLQAEDVEKLKYRKAVRSHNTPQQVYCNATGDDSEIRFFNYLQCSCFQWPL
jgi:hypothetical protein